MNPPSALSASASRIAARKSAQSRLQGRWLLLARGAWLSVAALGLTGPILSLPLNFAQLEKVCTGAWAACRDNGALLRPQDLPVLAQWGLSPTYIAAYGAVLNVLVTLVWSAMGVLIFWRRSAEPRALFFALCLVVAPGFTTPLLAEVHPSWWLPVTALRFLSDIVCLILFCFLFPTGQFVPRWTRWLALGWILSSAPFYFLPGAPLSHWMDSVSVPFAVGMPASVIVAQVYRYRRHSTLVERQQTKWVALALSVYLLLGTAWAPVVGEESSPLWAKLVVATTLFLSQLLIALAIAASILRYRLWEIDRLINRVLVYGLVTGLLGAIYAGMIIGLQALASRLTGQTGEPPLAIVVSTLLIAALILPVRRRIQTVIDRRFYRRKYDAQKTLAAFSATLRGEVDLEQVRERLLAVVAETMQPTQVWLWLRSPPLPLQPWPPRAETGRAPLPALAPHPPSAGSESALPQRRREGGRP